MADGDTIFALSSGPAPAGIAVIRVSGGGAGAVARALTGRTPGTDRLPARQARFARLCDPEDGELLDTGVALWFPGPGSFTGEDVAEFQIHGGAATIAAVLEAIGRCPGCRPAAAGAFARRAFANGRMDLTEAEGLSDLIAAETEAQRRLALSHAGGAGRDRYDAWTERLVGVLATLEAAVDFPEDDLPEKMLERNEIEIRALINEWHQDIEDGARTSRIREGVRIAILGAPNVGKSSLLNRLAGREAAIVSPAAGTTRDVVEVRLDLNGFLATVSDTAGLREATDAVEKEGVRRARRAAAGADLVLLVAEDSQTAERLLRNAALGGAPRICAVTKTDLTPAPAGWADGERRFAVSSATGAGLKRLVSALGARCARLTAAGAAAASIRQRHRDALTRASQALERALDAPEVALAGENVRAATIEIGRITGRVDVEAVLDKVFSEFCIGK